MINFHLQTSIQNHQLTILARLCSSWAIAELRFITGGGGGGTGQGPALCPILIGRAGGPLMFDWIEILEAGSQDDVDKDEEVEAESLLQEDSRLDSVSVDPVLPIDIVLPICIPIAFIGFDSPANHYFVHLLLVETKTFIVIIRLTNERQTCLPFQWKLRRQARGRRRICILMNFYGRNCFSVLILNIILKKLRKYLINFSFQHFVYKVLKRKDKFK